MTDRLEPWPVIFRLERDEGQGRTVVALFPHNSANVGRIACYAHIGQHSEATLDYYDTIKPATESQYRELLAELRSIYETGHDAVRLVVKQRLPADWRGVAWAHA